MGLRRLSQLLIGCIAPVKARAASFVVLAFLAPFAAASSAAEEDSVISPDTEELQPFTVQARTPALEDEGLYPCSECHDGDYVIANPERRELVDMHDKSEVDLVHGDGRFWCLTCRSAGVCRP